MKRQCLIAGAAGAALVAMVPWVSPVHSRASSDLAKQTQNPVGGVVREHG